MEKYKFGIIGTGGRGNAFARNLSKRTDAEIVGLCDPNPVRMENMIKTLELNARTYSSVTEMVRQEKLDAVIITSPDFCHESNAVEALEAGVNVLIDKPLATTVAGCRHIVEAAEKAGRVIMMGFNLRHDPTLKMLKKIIDKGELGRIFMIENREFYDGGRTYMSRWNRLYAKSGGLWIHKGSHDFDVFQWLLGFPKPVKVTSFAGINVLNPQNIPFEVEPGTEVGPYCHACAYRGICPDRFDISDIENSLWSSDASAQDGYFRDLCMYTSDKDTHDNGIAMVEYDNGARASHLECFVTSQSDRLYTVVGTQGQAEVSLRNRKIIVHPRWSKEVITHEIPEVKGGHGGADPGLLEHFIGVIGGQAENKATITHGMFSTAVGQAAEISRRENRLVMIDELFK